MNSDNFHRLIVAFYFAAHQTLTAALFRIFSIPLRFLFKRDSNLMVIISRPGSRFSDNSKYFFTYATGLKGDDEKVVYLTIDRNVYQSIIKAGGKAVIHPTLSSFWILIRCGTAVTDFDWFKFGAYPLTIGAKLVQLWHGAPLKHIELDLLRKRLKATPIWLHPLIKLQKEIIGRYPHYDYLVSTSAWFVDNVFRHCFKATRFIASGYPRNDILFGWPEPGSVEYRLAHLDVDMKTLDIVWKAKKEGMKICLYVPTFRNDMSDPFETQIELRRLSEFAQKNNFIFVLKLHPFMQGKYCINHYPHLIEYAPVGDVYPLMPHCDLLITDYSSIFFDFLLIDRPIIFFPYDLDHYISQDRAIYFDYDVMTPGPKCHSYEELEAETIKVFSIDHEDNYAKMRKVISQLTHDHKDNQATKRILNALRAGNDGGTLPSYHGISGCSGSESADTSSEIIG